jgi:hypothetical protein
MFSCTLIVAFHKTALIYSSIRFIILVFKDFLIGPKKACVGVMQHVLGCMRIMTEIYCNPKVVL